MMLAAHVHGTVISGSSKDYDTLFKLLMVKNLGKLTRYMCCSLTRDRTNRALSMSQESYGDKLSEQF